MCPARGRQSKETKCVRFMRQEEEDLQPPCYLARCCRARNFESPTPAGITEVSRNSYAIFTLYSHRSKVNPHLSVLMDELVNSVKALQKGQEALLQLIVAQNAELQRQVKEIREMLTPMCARTGSTSTAPRHVPPVPLFPSTAAMTSSSSLASNSSTSSSNISLSIPKLSLTDPQPAGQPGSDAEAGSRKVKVKAPGMLYHMYNISNSLVVITVQPVRQSTRTKSPSTRLSGGAPPHPGSAAGSRDASLTRG